MKAKEVLIERTARSFADLLQALMRSGAFSYEEAAHCVGRAHALLDECTPPWLRQAGAHSSVGRTAAHGAPANERIAA